MSAISLYARLTPGYEQRVAETVALLQEAAARHPGRIVFATSLGAEDMVLAELIARHRLPIALATLQTGQLHAETLALLPQLQALYGLTVEQWLPQAEAVLHFTRSHGELPMRQSIELRKACCALRKLEPLARALAGRSAWVTGLRREQSGARAEVPFEEHDRTGGSGGDTGSHGVDGSADHPARTKFNPLADWSQHDVWHHIATQSVPYNALHDAFFPSIGCEPCTRAVALGEDVRAGRWWWEHEDAKECGLHVAPTGTPAATGATGAAHRLENRA